MMKHRSYRQSLQTTRFGTLFVAGIAAVTCLVAAPSQASAAPRGAYDRLLAPRTACAGQLSERASTAIQKRAMACLIGYARARSGVRSVGSSLALNRSAQRKAGEIARCQQFSHTACGRAFDYWIRSYRYSGHRWGENIAWGSMSGSRATPRAIMRAWLYSDAHRINMLNGAFDARGIGLVRSNFQGMPSSVWVQHFGG